jgi:cell division protein FtsB
MNPGKEAKLDKANILSDAARMVAQLRGEAEKLKESNEKLRENIKDLKVSSSYSLSFLLIFLLDFRVFDALHMLLNVF